MRFISSALVREAAKYRAMIRSLILILGCLASSAPGWAADVLITYPGSATTLTEEDAKEFMLGKRTHWADGTPVLVGVVADPVQPALTGLTGITTQQFNMIWKKLLFTGKVKQLPATCTSQAELVAWVAHTPGSLAVVDQVALTDGVTSALIRK